MSHEALSGHTCKSSFLPSFRRLAQLRTGSHQLRVETGRWERPRVAREQRICQRCQSGEVNDEHHMEGRKIYMYPLTKPHGSCRGSGGSDMHKQIRNQNRDIKHPTA